MEQRFYEAQQELIDAKTEHWHAAEDVILAKETLDTEKAAATLAGVFDGKNAEIREAQAADHFSNLIAQIRQKESHERRAANRLEIAKISMRTLEQILRVRELEK